MKKKETEKQRKASKQERASLSFFGSLQFCVSRRRKGETKKKKTQKPLERKKKLFTTPPRLPLVLHSGTTTSLSLTHSLYPPLSMSILTFPLPLPQSPARISSYAALMDRLCVPLLLVSEPKPPPTLQ